jgi:hypothetical protein
MPSNLQREKWPLGWTPSADDTNGSPEGLLRMDNLALDKLGSLTLVRGFKNTHTNQLSGYVHSLYSTEINNVKHRFVGLSDGYVLHAPTGGEYTELVLDSGNPARARFSDVLGSVFIASGAKKRKFDGTLMRDWGIETPPVAVGISVNNQQDYDVSGGDGSAYYGWEAVEGVNFANSGPEGVHIDLDPDTLRSVIGIKYTKDFNAFPGGGKGLDTDVFSFKIRLGDSANIDRIRVEVGLGTVTDLNTLDNYYWMEWQHDIDNVPFTEGVDSFSFLQVARGAFTRAGDDATLDWSNVGALRVTLVGNAASDDNLVVQFKLTGSTKGPLNGLVEYIQVNVRDNGVYIGKSAIGPKFPLQVPVINASVTVTFCGTGDSSVNQKWLYRRGGILGQFFRIGVLDLVTGVYTDAAGNTQTSTGVIEDTCSDEKAQDSKLIANEFTTSIIDVDDEFISIIEGAYFERMIIATTKEILLTERLNPEAIDNRFKLSVSGDKTEAILWITKLSNTIIQIGTTKNRYELSGTLEDLPDGSIDALIRPLGEKHPPLGLEVALDSGSIIYIAEDGWRITTGGPSELLSPQLDLLFRGQTRHGIPPVQVVSNALVVYPVVVYKGQIVTSLPLTTGERNLFIYDLKLQYWRYVECNPICLFVESDGTLLGGFGSPGDYYVKQLDFGTTIDTNGTTSVGQRIFFQTVNDANGQPLNRKDAYTLKLLIDTGGADVNVYISGDGGGWLFIAKVNTTYLQNVFLDIFGLLTAAYGLGIRYGIRITSEGYNLTNFALNMVTILYEARPELSTTLRILPTNLGTFCRKRFTNFAFVADTLGYSVTFQPTIDGVDVETPLTFTNTGKKTIIYYFAAEQIGTDIGGLLTAVAKTATPVGPTNRGAFEYYGPNLEEIVSEKLPTPVKFLKIPASDYGTPNRKRHSSYKFQINTSGKNVRFIPILDGVAKSPATFNTAEKLTVEYFFSSDTTAIDIGGTLQTLEDTPFEYYGTIVPQHIEVLAPRLKELRIPESNYGIAAKKRIRTMPMDINTNGHNVTFTPIVDGVSLPYSTINTPTRKTGFHYFATDVFGIDFSGELISSDPFEFYGLLKPETVEVLPVSKRFDQVGPVHLARVGKVIGFRIRVITGEVNLPWRILAEDDEIASGTITTVPDIDDVYEVEWITKGRIAVISRLEIGPTTLPFNRYYVEFKINYGGNDSTIKRIRISDAFTMAQGNQ